MLSAAIIVFREVLEAALIIGIIAAATINLRNRNRMLLIGAAFGGIGSLLVAASAGELASIAEGAGQDIFNAAVLMLAVVMLAWHNVWMSRHAKDLAKSARQIGKDVSDGSREMSAVAVVIALAVLREGSETALFLYGLLISNEHSPAQVLLGGLAGLSAGAAAGVALYAGFVRIPVSSFFSVTSTLVLLLAASMASQVARFLVQADLLPSLASPVWDSSWLITNDSAIGTFLHALIGYEAMPSGMQILFYSTAFCLIAIGMKVAKRSPLPRTA